MDKNEAMGTTASSAATSSSTPPPLSPLPAVATDEEGTGTASATAGIGCEMCANYELQIQALQTEQDTLREQLTAAKELYEKYGKELSEERHYRKELEAKFAQLNDETEAKIQQCLGNVTSTEERLELLGKKQEADLAICFQDLERATGRQKELQNQLLGLNERYQKLLRTNSQCAEEMREQQIELPQTVEELQFLALQLREDLITERAAREHETREQRDELAVAREQLLEMEIRDKENEELLIQAQQQQQQHRRGPSGRRERASASTSHFECSTAGGGGAESFGTSPTGGGNGGTGMSEGQVCAQLESRLSFALAKCACLEQMLAESRQRCHQMQNELDTSEAVQKDFVRLSQQLQIELEKIRQSEIEVRWQEPEDVGQCNGCNRKFTAPPPTTTTKSSSKSGKNATNSSGSNDAADGRQQQRANCKHCGKIFCSNCLAHKVPSGPSKRSVTVCDLCHGLLSKEHSLVSELKPDVDDV